MKADAESLTFIIPGVQKGCLRLNALSRLGSFTNAPNATTRGYVRAFAH